MPALKWNIKEYEVLDSSNTEAKRLLEGGAGAGLVVWVHHQTGGKGRAGRTWWDTPGKSLMFSAVFEGLEGWHASALVAVAAAAAIREQGGTGPRLKWPNDLVYGGRKAGGILSETFRRAGSDFVITGLGINVGYLQEELTFPARMPATSLLLEEKKIWDRRALLEGILAEVDRRAESPIPELLREFEQNMAYRGELVRVANLHPQDEPGASGEGLEGIVEGIDETCNLLLRVEGRSRIVSSGDVTPLEAD